MKYAGNKLRHELKYCINKNDYYCMKQILKEIMYKDKNSIEDKGYFIRSLYYDDFNDSAYYDKIEGLFKRKKFRIRTYNNSKVGIKLEKKSKFGQYVSKTSLGINFEEYEAILNGDVGFLLKKNELGKDFYYQYNSFILRPRIIVDYEREAYVFDEIDVRITFDMDLKACIGDYDIFSDKLIKLFAMDNPETFILEVKYNEYLPKVISRFLKTLDKKTLALSKYVICREKAMR